MSALTGIGQASLALKKPRAALAATRRATELHQALDFAALDGMSSTLLWWTRSRALKANKQVAKAREALEMAYQFMLKGIASVERRGTAAQLPQQDRGASRDRRRLDQGCGARRLSAERRSAHLAGETNLREPFERLVDTGLRLNELRSGSELHDFLIDEATELPAQSACSWCSISLKGCNWRARSCRAARTPEALLREIAPSLDRSAAHPRRQTRAQPRKARDESTSALSNRSADRTKAMLGYLYVDIDGAFGRLRESDRDLLGMLASQAAVALDNAQWSQGLEQR